MLGYADHQLNRQFRDGELGSWFAQMRGWGLPLELEVGAVKEWGPTAEDTFRAEQPMWDRFLRLGAPLRSVAMDEPLCCVRSLLKKPDAYAVTETARFVQRVRAFDSGIMVGDIEPYPFLSVEDLEKWLDALQAELAKLNVRGLDFFRLDVDWQNFVVGRGDWRGVKRIEDLCRARGIRFSLIYWAADYPALEKIRLADDITWYVGVMQQAFDYAAVGGRPDQFVIESWIRSPRRCIPEDADATFTRSVLDLATHVARIRSMGSSNRVPASTRPNHHSGRLLRQRGKAWFRHNG
ncbi:MAG: hypothetical protein ACP5VE_15215 [Chthonomonadales bacterium]